MLKPIISSNECLLHCSESKSEIVVVLSHSHNWYPLCSIWYSSHSGVEPLHNYCWLLYNTIDIINQT